MSKNELMPCPYEAGESMYGHHRLNVSTTLIDSVTFARLTCPCGFSSPERCAGDPDKAIQEAIEAHNTGMRRPIPSERGDYRDIVAKTDPEAQLLEALDVIRSKDSDENGEGDRQSWNFVHGRVSNALHALHAAPVGGGMTEALIEALTPSAETKAAYMGEFELTVKIHDNEDGEEEVQSITVPWTTIKKIMAAIRGRAASRLSPPDKGAAAPGLAEQGGRT